ncbi:insulinoma-associated protein 1-like [Acropora millepora]|uniref:insulinoma-associated protein 1-like n=1 Tax=Acropora millepora TaxID=45264 RepID=UPI001CF5C8E9|nr:insulinoma-associated protein 1-like [Acropora millepora]
MPKAFLVKKNKRSHAGNGSTSEKRTLEYNPLPEYREIESAVHSTTSAVSEIMHSSPTKTAKVPVLTSLTTLLSSAPNGKANSTSAFTPFKVDKEKENSPAKKFKPGPTNIETEDKARKARDSNRATGRETLHEKHTDHGGKTAVLEHKEFAICQDKFDFPKPKGPLPQSQFICQLCQEIYSDPFSLAQHKCSGIQHTEYRCPECDKVFSCPANLASHRRWHRPRSPHDKKPAVAQTPTPRDQPASTNTKPNVEGSKIGVAATDSDDCTRAASPVGNSQGQFVCEVCNKTFRRKAYLRKHMNNHNDDRPYPCQYCGKVFRSLTNRAKHVLNHAVGPKTFICNVCGNGFANKGSLDRHARIHTGEIYSCKHCSSTFYSSPGLTRHMNKCHPPENRPVIVLQVPVRQG